MPLSIVIGIVRDEEGKIFITRRHDTLHLGGLWEFPGGKVERGEMLGTALARELREEIGIEVISAVPLISFQHAYSDREIHFHVFDITEYTGKAQSQLGQGWIWAECHELQHYIFPAANRIILMAIYLPSFYAILNDDCEDLLARLEHLLAQGITLIQARLKNLSESQVREFLEIAHPRCNEQGALLLVNSGTVKAVEMSCDGIHLTGSDLLTWDSRPENLHWLSASCHNQAELKHAQKIGVDFVVLSPVLRTETHLDVEPLGWETFESLIIECNLPVYALGGVQKSDLQTAKFAGGQGIAGIRTFL
ncbi:MAG: Nudix family hydrolase [Methylococcales bacterium]|nr:Nudix family hydrolase [Methylococcales bacterium]